MRNDPKYAKALLSIKVQSGICVLQAQGHLSRTFSITMKTAAKATDRLLNGTYDRNDNKVAPLVELAECKTKFVLIDQEKWQEKHARLTAMAKAQDEGKLSYIHSARVKRNNQALQQASRGQA